MLAWSHIIAFSITIFYIEDCFRSSGTHVYHYEKIEFQRKKSWNEEVREVSVDSLLDLVSSSIQMLMVKSITASVNWW